MRARQGCPVRVNIKRSFVAWCHQVGRWASGEHYKAGLHPSVCFRKRIKQFGMGHVIYFQQFWSFFEISSNTEYTHNSCHNGQPYIIVHKKLNKDVLVWGSNLKVERSQIVYLDTKQFTIIERSVIWSKDDSDEKLIKISNDKWHWSNDECSGKIEMD